MLKEQDQRVHIFPPVPLKDLGIRNRRDWLGLNNLEITLARIETPQSQDTIHLGWIDHPFIGQHLVQLVSAVINPAQFADKFGVVDDFQMPAQAASQVLDRRKGSARLHRIHNEDPYVGAYYQEFIRDHGTQWLRLCETNKYDATFLALQRISLIELSAFVSKMFSWLRSELLLNKNPIVYHVAVTAFRYRGGDALLHLLHQRPEFDREDDDTTSSLFLERIDSNRNLPTSQETEILVSLLDEMRHEDREGFATNYQVSLYGSPILIDVNRRQIWRKDEPNLRASFANDSTVLFEDATGCEAKVKISGKDSGNFSWSVIGYKFPPSLRAEGINGLLAWRKAGSGERRFLSQEEVRPLLGSIGSEFAPNEDVMLGRVLAKYFSEGVELPRKMKLHKGGYSQTMMGAQAAVLVSLPVMRGYRNRAETGPAAKMLSDENPLFPVLERYAT